MSRLRRLVVSDRWLFITCQLLARRRILIASEFAALAEVIRERRAEHEFSLTAWAGWRRAQPCDQEIVEFHSAPAPGIPDYGDQATPIENESVIAGWAWGMYQNVCHQ